MSINKAVISGNLTRDPELRQTKNGNSVLNFSIAVNDRRRNQQTGEWEEYPNFIDCTMFGNRAQAVSQWLAKGTKVAVEGRLHWSQREKDGQKRSKVEVWVEEVEFMSSRQAQQPAYGERQPQGGIYAAQRQTAPQQPLQGPYAQQARPTIQQGYYAAPTARPAPQATVYDEDIPF